MSSSSTSSPARTVVDRADSEDPQSHQRPYSSRRALIGSAIDGIQRFKQSWKSVMFLKASVGLGQVVALIVLLVLASILPSPLYPDIKQADKSDSCPQPGLLQAWMIVQIFRLTTCWSVSCWVAVRAQRALRRERLQDEQLESRITRTDSTVEPRSTGPRGFGSQPSLSHSVSTGSTSTLAGFSNSTHERNASPPTDYAPTMQSSSATINALSPVETKGAPLQQIGLASTSTFPVVTTAEIDRSSLQRARGHADELYTPTPESAETLVTRRGFASRIDRYAPAATKSLGLFSIVLFILGNILLFYPLPSKQSTCYHAAPMLWWGVMTVTGVGWFLVCQILFVVVFVGIGGQAVLAVLRRLRIVPTAPEPVQPRPPQPDPLTPHELSQLQIVCFVPHPDPSSAPSSPTEVKSMAEAQSGPPKAKWDWTRFPHPAHYLKVSKAMCAICQENFTEPREVKRILYDAQPLRLLGCGHVYHTNCIDKWLMEKSGICPFCNTAVRSTLSKEKCQSDNGETKGRRWLHRGSNNPS